MTTLAELDSLPAVLDARGFAELLDCSTDHVYAMVREGNCPVEPLRLGRSLRWPTPRVLAVLGITRREGSAALTNDASNGITVATPDRHNRDGRANGTP